MRDPKDSFYRYLELDADTKKIIKWYRKIAKDLQNDKYDKNFVPMKEDENERV